MIDAEALLDHARRRGISLIAGVPCSYLGSLIDCASRATTPKYVMATNEGDAVAVAIGSYLGGQLGAVFLQNSGLGNAINPLASLCIPLRIPCLLFCGWRSAPGQDKDEPQHALMGRITTQLLDLLEIAWEEVPGDANIGEIMSRAISFMTRNRRPYALLFGKGSFGKVHNGARLATAPTLTCPRPISRASIKLPTRKEIISEVRRLAPEAALIATTGYMGRALLATGDSERNFYVIGGMGCASSIGMGVALARPNKQIIVLDGDGAALMRMGALSMIGHYRPSNMVHFVLDNEAHASTGGQPTSSSTTDLAAVAAACGYERVAHADTALEVAERIRDSIGNLTFVHIKVSTDDGTELPRPCISPHEMTERFAHWVGQGPVTYTREL